jgi:predicted ATPase
VSRDLPSGTVTLLFTDVEGSTKLLHELGAEAYAEALAAHRRVVREAFAVHGGVEVDTQGDAFFVAFPSAAAGIAAARAAQEALAAGPIRVRMGLHTGTPHLTGEGYVGEDVHLGARLAAAGHGRQVLLSAATRAHVGGELTDLGEHRLKDFAEPVWIFQLGLERFPPLKTVSNTNLPRPASSFVGRERELAELTALLQDGARFVTLTGPGGTGKTRLAIETAAELLPEFAAGVFWVGLATLRDPTLVVDTIAQTLGAKDALAEHVGERELLLLLDNLEQVIDAATELAGLLEACPNLRLLVTTRELLRVRGEVEYTVPPLAEPEAVELFCTRSRLEANAAIAELCRRLDSLPLAVELAAARTSVLSPAQILERLGKRLDLLKGGRDAEARQQTLRAAIAWSHDLLDSQEQRLFARLSVFAGGCTLDAAEDICGVDLDTLQSLVDKSLLRHTDERFWMLETIREYASEQLDASGERDALRRRHADYFLALAEEAEPGLRQESPVWLERLECEHDNLSAALDRLETARRYESVLRLAAALARFWDRKGYLAEGRHRIEGALEREVGASPARAKALNGAALLASRTGDAVTARQRAEEGLKLHRELGDTWGTADSALWLGFANFQQANIAGALRLYAESRRLFAEAGDEHAALHATRFLAGATTQSGDLGRARELYEELREGAQALRWKPMEAESLAALGEGAVREGRLADAVSLLTQAIHMHRDIDEPLGIAQDLARFASARAREGRAATAVRLLAASQTLHEEIGASPSIWVVRMNEATLSIVRAQIDDASIAEAWEHGRTLTADDAVALALDSLGTGGATAGSRPPGV